MYTSPLKNSFCTDSWYLKTHRDGRSAVCTRVLILIQICRFSCGQLILNLYISNAPTDSIDTSNSLLSLQAEGHPIIEKCSQETLRVNGQFCGLTLYVSILDATTCENQVTAARNTGRCFLRPTSSDTDTTGALTQSRSARPYFHLPNKESIPGTVFFMTRNPVTWYVLRPCYETWYVVELPEELG
jgi:hypothetical protein